MDIHIRHVWTVETQSWLPALPSNLTTSDSNFGGVVRCVLSADNVQNENGKLESNPVSYEVVDLRPIVKLEAYTFDNQYKTQTINLETTNTFTIDSNLFGPDYSIIQFHCPEEEVTLTLDMYGAKGIDNNNSIGSYDAGNGGQSRVEGNNKLSHNFLHELPPGSL